MSAARVGRAAGEAGDVERRHGATDPLRVVRLALCMGLLVIGGVLPTRAAGQPGALPSQLEAGLPRVISLAPGATRIVDRLGAGDAIVARARDDRSAVVRNRPLIGTLLRPDPERMLAARPDLVILTTFSDPGRLDAVRGAGADLLAIRLERIADVVPAVRRIAEAVALTGPGDALAEEIERDLDVLRRMSDAASPVATVWAVGLSPIMVAGPGGIADDLLTLAGGTNLFPDAPSPWFRPSREGLRSRSPDVLVWPAGGDLPLPDDLPASSPWREYLMLHRPRVVVVDAELVHEVGPRVAQAAALLFERLHAGTVPASSNSGPHR